MEDRREQSGFEHRNSHDDEETRPTHVHCAQQKMNAQQATYNTCPTQIDLEAMGRACLTEADSVGKALRVMRAPGDMASMESHGEHVCSSMSGVPHVDESSQDPKPDSERNRQMPQVAPYHDRALCAQSRRTREILSGEWYHPPWH